MRLPTALRVTSARRRAPSSLNCKSSTAPSYSSMFNATRAIWPRAIAGIGLSATRGSWPGNGRSTVTILASAAPSSAARYKATSP